MCWFSLPSWLVASSRPIAPFSAVLKRRRNPHVSTTVAIEMDQHDQNHSDFADLLRCIEWIHWLSPSNQAHEVALGHWAQQAAAFSHPNFPRWHLPCRLAVSIALHETLRGNSAPLRLVQDHIVIQKICNSLRIVVNRCFTLLVYVFSSLFIHSHFELANRPMPHFLVPVQGSSQCGAAELRSQAIPLRPLPPPWHSTHLPCGVGLFLGWLRGKFPICHALNCSGTVVAQSFSCNYMCKKIFLRAFLVGSEEAPEEFSVDKYKHKLGARIGDHQVGSGWGDLIASKCTRIVVWYADPGQLLCAEEPETKRTTRKYI